jgi:hypothetical protein
MKGTLFNLLLILIGIFNASFASPSPSEPRLKLPFVPIQIQSYLLAFILLQTTPRYIHKNALLLRRYFCQCLLTSAPGGGLIRLT